MFALAIATGQFCALTRYIVLARLLGPAELGLAVLIVLTGQFFDSITDSGYDRFLIQDRDGDTPKSQRLVQLVAIARGAGIAGLLLLCADPIAAFFDSPELPFGLRLLAIAPFIAGFMNLDLRRMQRAHDFRIEGTATLIAELVGLAATTGVALATGSYLAIIAGLVARSTVLVIVSHVMAHRPYSAGWSRSTFARLALFGGPLMINGVLLFFGSQGDRLLIGKLLGVEEVGLYSAVALLIFYPIMVMQRLIASLYLPRIVASAPNRLQQIDELGGLTLVVAVLASMGFAAVAPFAVPLFFGAAFGHSSFVIALVGILNAARFLRLWPVNILLAEGHTGRVLATNIVRLVAFPLAIGAMLILYSLETLVMIFIGAELFALVVGVVLANRALGQRQVPQLQRIALFIVGAAATATIPAALAAGAHTLAATALATCVVTLAVIARVETAPLAGLVKLLPWKR